MKIDNRDIFEQIGNAFYAIAAEQNVKPLEVAELKLLISDDWLPRNINSGDEHMVSEEAHCILTTMDSLQGDNVTAGQAFREFEKFLGLHPEVFTSELKQRIFNTAKDIVKIFQHDNTSSNKHLIGIKKVMGISEPIASKA